MEGRASSERKQSVRNVHLGVTCAALAMACGSRQSPATPSARSDEVDASTVTVTDDDAGAPAPSMGANEAWAWLRSELPAETANFRMADDHALGALLAWAPVDGTITAFDAGCRPLKLARGESSLDGDINVHTTITGSTKAVSGESISFGRRVTVTCGFDQTYERADGGWSLVQQGATGCDHDLGHRLSGVSDDAASYDAVDAEIQIHCAARHERVQQCSNGTSRTCSSCDRIGFDVSSREGHSRGVSPRVLMHDPAPGQTVDCAQPCPPDDRAAKIGPANAALAQAPLETIRADHPLLFRTMAACRASPHR